MAGYKLVSINIERSKHLDTVMPFLKAQAPDVVTLQEVMERDLKTFEEALGMKSVYLPTLYFAANKEEGEGNEGLAIFSREFASSGSAFYAGEFDPIMRYTQDTPENIVRQARGLIYADISFDGEIYRFVNTHFTWTPAGIADELQQRDLQSLFTKLDDLSEFILTGDFNAPRGRKTWDMIAAKYKDNIPAHYTSSIDPMHRAAPLPYVVDGLFTTPAHIASEVEFHEGISDHKAISALIQKSYL